MGGRFLTPKQGKKVHTHMFTNTDLFHGLHVHPTSILRNFVVGPPKTIGLQGLLEKYLTFFFCKNLVGFNEMHLHEAILNLHMHA